MKTQKQPPVAALAVGTGLVALDVVITEGGTTPPRHWAGGTCGNVLLALRYLGWHSAPVARLQSGDAAGRVLEDLQHWGVSTEHVSVEHDGSTPIIVQKIGRTLGGEPYHTFSWRCPNCGTRLPAYKPVLASAAHEIANRLASPAVFFFDRLSRGALLLAKAAAERGAAVVFEPSSVGNLALFREAWQLAHIVKYSHERLNELPGDLEAINGPRLQVETLGREGLRYRSRLPGCKKRAWQRLEALPADEVKDTAGAGDWCTAGITHKLLGSGAAGLNQTNDTFLRDSVRYGQALSAWNCGFEGARGGMYAVDKTTFERHVERILGGGTSGVADSLPTRASDPDPPGCLCPSCEVTEVPSRTKRNALRTRR